MTMTPCFLDTGLGIVPPDWSGVRERVKTRVENRKKNYILGGFLLDIRHYTSSCYLILTLVKRFSVKCFADTMMEAESDWPRLRGKKGHKLCLVVAVIIK